MAAIVVRRAVSDGFTHAAFADLFLEDIRRYREERLAGTGLTPIFPLFGSDTRALAHEMIAGGLGARLTCVDPRVLDRRFAGREFDESLLAELPGSIDPCGERGEFHTFAYRGPMFRRSISIDTGVTVAAAHVNPVIGVNVASLTVHVFPVGIPPTLAEPPAPTGTDPVNAVVPSVSTPQS
jgi:diphthamide synthase (EF-2-diphthine--ammonia ligase)